MDKCFNACGCDEFGISPSDLDRFTDKIENVLNDERGRKLFRNFMFTTKMKSGRRTLDFLDNTDKLLEYRENSEGQSYRSFLRNLDRLIEEAERIEELDFATIERLIIGRESENLEQIHESLKVVKAEATHALRREYVAFRNHFLQFK